MRLLILDNYDSFTYNLVHLVEGQSDISFDVFQNNAISVKEVAVYDKIILSPGPGLPKDAGIMPELLARYHHSKSILGVCLGFQAIGEAFGCSLQNSKTVFHGLGLPVNIVAKDPLFENCPPRFIVGRYHSWVINRTSIGNKLLITAEDDAGLVMAARHPRFDVCGVQFHPESILSEYGALIIKNWLSGSALIE